MVSDKKVSDDQIFNINWLKLIVDKKLKNLPFIVILFKIKNVWACLFWCVTLRCFLKYQLLPHFNILNVFSVLVFLVY